MAGKMRLRGAGGGTRGVGKDGPGGRRGGGVGVVLQVRVGMPRAQGREEGASTTSASSGEACVAGKGRVGWALEMGGGRVTGWYGERGGGGGGLGRSKSGGGGTSCAGARGEPERVERGED